jgi:hypothetical protein
VIFSWKNVYLKKHKKPVLGIRDQIRWIRMFLGLPGLDPDPHVFGPPAPDPASELPLSQMF